MCLCDSTLPAIDTMVAAAVAMPAAVAVAPAAEAAATIPTDVALTMHVCGVAQLLIGKKAGCGGKATCNKEFCIKAETLCILLRRWGYNRWEAKRDRAPVKVARANK